MSERVNMLRAELRRRGLSAFIVPHEDEYQNEYVPACAERLAWLTGFTGSAGMAVVLADQAAVFVDGRYTLQVRQQIDQGVFEVRHCLESPVYGWLSDVLKPGDTLGYDPWLHTPQEVGGLQKVCVKARAELVACETNPVDAVWHDRPAPPAAPVVPHALVYAGMSSEDKRRTIAAQLVKAEVEVVVLAAPDSIAWLLNVRGGDVAHTPLPLGFALLFADGATSFFLDSRKVSDSLVSHLGTDVFLCDVRGFAAALDRLGKDGMRVLCDPTRTASWIPARLAQAGARVVEGDDPCELPKACKHDVEVNGAREAHRRDGEAVCHFLAWMDREAGQGRLSELDAQSYLDDCRRRQPLCRDLSFPTISASGSNGAIMHYRATEACHQMIQPGALYMVDSGGQYLDGTTDITRTIAIGVPTQEHRDRYTRVLRGLIALATAVFPEGTTGAQLDGLARRPLWDAGLDYDHGTGHGVGSYLGVHEGPQRITRSSQVALRPGMIVSNEPGYYKSGAYGIRLENLVVVIPAEAGGKDGRSWLTLETITLAPFDPSLIDASALQAGEVEWLNAYHARVREVIGPLVDEATAGWLRRVTEPLDSRSTHCGNDGGEALRE